MKKQLNVEIGRRIRKSRETIGYTRETLAEKANLAASFLGTIELGSGSFTAESLIKICRALNVSADYILFGKDDECDLSAINAMLSGLDPAYLLYVEEMLSSYIGAITNAKK